MKYLVDARFVGGKDPALEMAAEVARVNELRQQGIIEQVIKRTDATGAYLVMELAERSAVNEALCTLPFAKSGTMSFTINEVEIL